VYVTYLSHGCCQVHEFNESLFNIVISFVSLVIVIFYCANTTAFMCLAGNFRKGSLGQIGLDNGLLHEKS